MPKNNSASIVVLHPNEFFHAAVNGALEALRVRASEHAQHYLVTLLAGFVAKEELYPKDEDGRQMDTLTEQLAKALEAGVAAERASRLRQLGDFSLYVAGFFSNSLQRKLVDVDYYIGMGEAAYGNVARLEPSRAELFDELSHKFPQFVDVLGQISDEAGLRPEDNQSLLRTYDLWVKTKSERLAKQLLKAGIQPVTRKPDEGDS
ncbi:MAG: hypothetical protein HUU37_02990 [Bdellovibrionales bacterium]|nr:hypothetical protein [Bdellovibrionales bacterium]